MKPILIFAFLMIVVTACKKNTNREFTPRSTQAGPNPDGLPEKPLPDTIRHDMFLSNDTCWILNGYCYLTGNSVLIIQEGARVEANVAAALIVTQGSMLYANGTSTAPILFTFHEANPYRGSWYGIVLLGKAPVNQPDPGFESIPGFAYPQGVPDGVDVHYGGTDVHDASGEMTYVRIEYAGNQLAGSFNDENELDGLTCAGVGDNTILDFIEVAYSGGDAFQFYGGTVNARHIFALVPYKDAFDFDLGYDGSIQYAVSALNPSANYSLSSGIESHTDNGGSHSHGGNYPSIPFTRPRISNMTVIGLESSWNADGYGVWFDKSSSYYVRNSIFMGYRTGLNLGSAVSQSAVNNFRFNMIHAFNTLVNPTTLLTTVQGNNNSTFPVGNANDNFQLFDPFNPVNPDFRPVTGSPAVTLGTSYTGLPGYPGFFDSTSYRGAFDAYSYDPTFNNWLAGWAKYDY